MFLNIVQDLFVHQQNVPSELHIKPVGRSPVLALECMRHPSQHRGRNDPHPIHYVVQAIEPRIDRPNDVPQIVCHLARRPADLDEPVIAFVPHADTRPHQVTQQCNCTQIASDLIVQVSRDTHPQPLNLQKPCHTVVVCKNEHA